MDQIDVVLRIGGKARRVADLHVGRQLRPGLVDLECRHAAALRGRRLHEQPAHGDRRNRCEQYGTSEIPALHCFPPALTRYRIFRSRMSRWGGRRMPERARGAESEHGFSPAARSPRPIIAALTSRQTARLPACPACCGDRQARRGRHARSGRLRCRPGSR